MMPYRKGLNNAWSEPKKDFWDSLDSFLFKMFPQTTFGGPTKESFQAIPIDPYRLTLSTTKQALLQPIGIYKKIYYVVVYVENMGTATEIYIDTNNSEGKVTLTNYNSNAEWEAPYRSWLDLTNYKVSCDAGASVITVWGVAYV
jgi:hypothetical protein